MARLPQPRRSAFCDVEDREAYDAVVKRRRALGMAGHGEQDAADVGEYFGALLQSPRLCAIAARMGAYVRTVGDRDDSYSHADREFVDQVLSADFKTNVVQQLHVPDAVSAGVRLEAIEALRYGDEAKLSDDERLLARYIRQVVAGTVDDDTHTAMLNRLGPRGLIDYAAFILWLQWIMRMMQALGVADPPDATVDVLIAGLRDGTVEVPDFRVRIG